MSDTPYRYQQDPTGPHPGARGLSSAADNFNVASVVAHTARLTPTMTPGEREELARAMARADGHEIVAVIDPNRPDDDFQSPQITDAGALSMYAGLADAIAPIIERMVAERVAGAEQESERRATAAIVVWLRAHPMNNDYDFAPGVDWAATAIERGDHLKPLDT